MFTDLGRSIRYGPGSNPAGLTSKYLMPKKNVRESRKFHSSDKEQVDTLNLPLSDNNDDTRWKKKIHLYACTCASIHDFGNWFEKRFQRRCWCVTRFYWGAKKKKRSFSSYEMTFRVFAYTEICAMLCRLQIGRQMWREKYSCSRNINDPRSRWFFVTDLEKFK